LKDDFAFALGAQVTIDGNESGKVIGRAEYAHAERTYLILYRAGDGRTVQNWWGESALTAAA
jgi:hypothetical protein